MVLGQGYNLVQNHLCWSVYLTFLLLLLALMWSKEGENIEAKLIDLWLYCCTIKKDHKVLSFSNFGKLGEILGRYGWRGLQFCESSTAFHSFGAWGACRSLHLLLFWMTNTTGGFLFICWPQYKLSGFVDTELHVVSHHENLGCILARIW